MATENDVTEECAEGQEEVDVPKPSGGTVSPGGTTATWTPPTREEWEKVTGALRETATESRKRKEKLREIEAANATEEERKAAEVEERVRTETEGKWRPRLVASEARSALAAAGCTDLQRLARLIDTSAVEIDDVGAIIGMKEQVDALKADYPEAFKRERRASTGDGVVNPGTTRAPAQRKTASERQAEMLLGRR